MFSFWGICLEVELPKCFPQWLHHFTFPPAMYKVPISLPLDNKFLFSVCCGFFLSFYSHPGGYEVVLHYGYDLRIPNE